MKTLLKKYAGTTLIELLLYIAIFLALTPILLAISLNAIRSESLNSSESKVSSNSYFVIERIYDNIVNTKRIDVENSVLNDPNGKLTLILQNDDELILELNPTTRKIEITEDGVTSNLTSDESAVDYLYFERITDSVNDPEIILGINVRLQVSGLEEYDVAQNYLLSANLERGDFDEDGCPDYIDKYPKHPQCCGDADGDAVCDELDNCVIEYNPFQEDYDGDEIGDECDETAFGGGGGGGGGGLGGAFNCNPDDQLLALINQDPPLSSSTLKSILLSASPLSPTVLMALIDNTSLLTNGHFRQVFIANTILPEGILDAIVADGSVPTFNKIVIVGADLAATYIPWLLRDNRNYANYEVTLYSDAEEPETWINRVKYHDADVLLGSSEQTEKTDIFVISVNNASSDISVTTETVMGFETNILTIEDNYIIDDNGYAIELDGVAGTTYNFLVSSAYSEDELISIEFDFGEGSDITSPSESTYETDRYICYCEGGCADDCGDIGTGIITTNVYTDKCYTWDSLFPEWCSHWYTFEDDDSENPAFIGGTQEGEANIYWEKSFKSVLTLLQLAELDSITVGAEVAYQSLGQFFCDTLAASCPMNGNLVGGQDIQLYNWDTETWETIGTADVDGTISDQQAYEVKYADADVLKYLGGKDNVVIKARAQFNWNGVAPGGTTSAPCFMLIDYFTLHLKW
ncbi:hypothetical protein JW758_01815 [Candidatus Peregrinibacteria bacterium]|nr:hypothetical protein [Candidatus Peregrinibacteria bacterium]